MPDEWLTANAVSEVRSVLTGGDRVTSDFRLRFFDSLEEPVAKPDRKKHRVDFRKNRGQANRDNDFTRRVQQDEASLDNLQRESRVNGRGDLSRRRTIVGTQTHGDQIVRDVDVAQCERGRVLSAIGATQCTVQTESGERVTCTIRRVLRTMQREARNAVVAGDIVLFARLPGGDGVIERVEPRQGVLSRGHQHQQHILVANITQLAIVGSAEEPPLKPALIDRFLVTAAKGGVRPLIVITKADLVDLRDLQPVIGLYSRLGYRVVPTSIETGLGIASLRAFLANQQTVFSGQSGVGKSSLLNAIDEGLTLKTGTVSTVTQKGRHTTRYSELIPLRSGGWVVDTPGIRQMELWNVQPAEIEGYFPEFRPFVPLCRYPNCQHIAEDECAVRRAVQMDLISQIRYESYVRMFESDLA